MCAYACVCMRARVRLCTCECVRVRGLRVQLFCYPTLPRSTRPLPVPVPDPYSKLLPDPTRTRGYTRTRQAVTFKRSYAYSLHSKTCIVILTMKIIVKMIYLIL